VGYHRDFAQTVITLRQGARWRQGLIIAIGATIGCDRVTKHVAATTLADASSRSFLADTFRLEYVENTGAFLGLGADWPLAVRTTVFGVGNGLLLSGIFNVADMAIMLGAGILVLEGYRSDGPAPTKGSS